VAGLERELKVEVDEAFAVPDLIQLVGLSVVSLPEVSLAATYYDTASLELARWGVTLRHRTSSSGSAKWTLKLPDPPEAGAERLGLSRDEIDFDAPPGSVPGPATSLLTTYIRDEPLAPVAQLNTRRRRHLLLSATDTLAELDDDSVDFELPDGRSGSFRELEIELAATGPPAILGRIHDTLVEAGVDDSVPRPKVVRALGEAPGPLLPVVSDWRTSMTTAELVQRTLSTTVGAWLTDDPRLRLGEDQSALARVYAAVRRLHSQLDALGRWLDRTWVERVIGALGSFSGHLADLADLDAVVGRLAGAATRLAPEDQSAAVQLSEMVAGQRRSHHDELAKLMDSTEYLELVDELVAAAWEPPLVRGGSRPALATWEKAARRRVERLAGESDARWLATRHPSRRPAHPPDEDLTPVDHAVADALFAVELALPLGSRAARALRAALGELEQLVTELHQSTMSERWLRDSAGTLDGHLGLAAGLLLASETERVDQASRAWRPAWKTFRQRARKWPGT